MFGAFNTFGKLGAPAGGRSLLAQIQSMGASFIGIPSLSNYQDSAGTTLVTQPGGGATDPPVGKVLDLSGLGNHATQSTSPARPKLSARINRLEHTEDFYSWDATEITVVNAAATAPNGTMTCSFLRDSASFSVHAVAFDLGTTPKDAPVYASAYFAKFGLPNSKRYAYMSMVIGENTTTDYRYAVNLDLQTGTVTEAKTGAQVSGGVTTIVSDGSFWHVTLRAVPLTESYTFMIVGNSNSATPAWNTYWDVEYAGDGVSGSYVWGTQWANAILPYQRVTDASNYDYSGFPLIHQFDGVDDAHVITFASSLGTDCTVVTANRGTTPTIATAQTIGTSHTISATHAGKLIFPRALTAAETATVTAWATRQGAL